MSNLNFMSASDLAKHILDNDLSGLKKNVPSEITDLVFLKIEERYLKEYEAACSRKGKDQVNKIIGKTVREYWGLQNNGKCVSPRSKLISSYERH